MLSPVTLPAGDYRVRFAADGYLSQEAKVTLKARQPERISCNLNEQLAFEPIRGVHDVAFVQYQSQTLRVAYDQHQLRFRSGDGPESNLPWTTMTSAGSCPGWIWPIESLVPGENKFGMFETRPWILPQGEDVNRDRRIDCVLAFRNQARVGACGADGWLWVRAAGSDLAEPLSTVDPSELRDSSSHVGDSKRSRTSHGMSLVHGWLSIGQQCNSSWGNQYWAWAGAY